MVHVDSFLWLIPALPLLGFLINGTLGFRMPAPSVGLLAVAGPLASFVIAVLALLQAHHGDPAHQVVWTWISTGTFVVDFGLQADALTCVMLMNVTGIGTAITVYSYGYMREDPGFPRFMAYLNLFLCAMLLLVMGDNLLVLFVGWEGVGLCSYLLIGYWYEDFANVDAGRKAFLVNRIGDFAFLIGAFTLFALTGTLRFDGMEAAVHGMDLSAVLTSGPLAGFTTIGALTLAALCLFGGATGKSAQIPLYVWLPDAMAGPTPVSALIHAATMVTAGIYLVGRMDFLFVLLPHVTETVAFVAAATAVLSGLIAVAQNDIKKVLAYSTVSQLGFMFCGMASTEWASGLFHVVTHAFFKALLFLGAGAVIVAMHHEQDIRKMGGLWRDLKGVAVLFILGALALGGVFPFSGFWSKDEILAASYLQMTERGGLWSPVFVMLVFTAGLTAFYTTRLVILTFFGAPANPHRHLHPVHWTMTSVLAALAVLATFGGWLAEPIHEFTAPVWVHAASHVSAEAHHAAHDLAVTTSVVVATLGIAAAVVLYGTQRKALAAFVEGPGRALHEVVENKFYVDEAYDLVVVRPVGMLARGLYAAVDRFVVDGWMVEGPGLVVLTAGQLARIAQVGAVSVATAATLVGAVVVLLWMVAHG
jgi:NADH-quinone oxidoreductase subunit L